MPIDGWDHVEFWVGNAKQSAYFYEHAFGFAPVAYAGPETGVRDRASYVLGQGDIRFVFSTALREEHEIARHAVRHGDGVKDILVADLGHFLPTDDKVDVLYTNGDVMDSFILKPYHSVQWLENRGKFPFVHHPLTRMYGVHRAVAADFRGTGRKDIVAVSFLPARKFRRRRAMKLDSVIYLQQTRPGKFVRYSLEQGTCDHVTCAAGDLYGDGNIHLVTGNFCMERGETLKDSITIWEKVSP